MGISSYLQNSLLDKTVRILSKTLDYRSANQQVITENLANADTPGFKFKELHFDQELKRAYENTKTQLETTNPNHFSHEVSIGENDFPIEVTVGDNVGSNQLNIDREMARMMSNNLLYEATTRLLSNKIRALKSAIDGTWR